MVERLEWLAPQSAPAAPQRLDWLSPVQANAPASQSPQVPPPVTPEPPAAGLPPSPKSVGELVDFAMPGTKPKVDAGVEMARSGARGALVPKSNLRTMDEIRGRDPRVDYKTGTDFDDAVALYQAANPREEQRYLETKYGRGRVFQDKGGTFYVEKDGKFIAPGVSGAMNIPAWVLAEGAPIAGGTVGAIAGFGAGGPPGAIAGAGIGTAAGRGVNEAYKMIRGRFDQTPGELSTGLAIDALGGMAGEGVGRAITSAPRAAANLYRSKMTGGTPETEQLTALTTRAGGVPPIASVAPESKRLQFKEAYAEKTVGPFNVQRNLKAVDDEVQRVVQDAGYSPQDAQALLKEVMDPTARTEAAQSGTTVKNRVVGHVKALEQNIETYAKSAQQQIDDQLRGLKAIPRAKPAGELGPDIADSIGQARKDFSRASSKIYQRVDEIVGDAPVVPSAPIRRAALDIYKSLPKTKGEPAGPPGRERNWAGAWEETPGTPATEGTPVIGDARVLKILNDLQQVPEKINFSDAQRIRSSLGELATMTDLTPGVSKRQFDQLRRAVDQSLSVAARDPAAAPAVSLLRTADKFYSDGIKKFEDAMINRLVAQAKAGTAPDPTIIADQVLKPGMSARAQEIRRMVGPEIWRRVASADFDNILKEATDPATREIDARRLANAVNSRRDMLGLTYGTQLANELDMFSKRVAAQGGKIPAGSLSMDTFGQTMRQLEAANKRLDDFMKKSPMAAIAKDNKLDDQAIAYLVQPGHEVKLAEAVKFFGENSPPVQAIRTQALKELLASAVITTESGANRTIAGNALETALSQFTAKQQKLLFPNGLDDDLRLLAKEIKFLFPERKGDMAAGLAAGVAKASPLPVYAAMAVPAYIWGWILSRPETVKTLAFGLRQGGAKAEAVKQTIHAMSRLGAYSAKGDEPRGKPALQPAP